MKEALSEIIQLATVDTEPWVLMVADILKIISRDPAH